MAKRKKKAEKPVIEAGKESRSMIIRRAKADGYIICRGRSGREEMEHREVWKREVGPIPRGWVIHHINEDKRDNRIENLVAMPAGAHDYLHKAQRWCFKRATKEGILKFTAQWQKRCADIDKEVDALDVQIAELTRKRTVWLERQYETGSADVDEILARA